MKTKKVLFVVLSVAMAVCLSACTDKTKEPDYTAKTAAVSVTEFISGDKYNMNITYNDDIILGPDEFTQTMGTPFGSVEYGKCTINIDSTLYTTRQRTVQGWLESVSQFNVQPKPEDITIGDISTITVNGLDISYVDTVQGKGDNAMGMSYFAFNITEDIMASGFIMSVDTRTMNTAVVLDALFKTVVLEKI